MITQEQTTLTTTTITNNLQIERNVDYLGHFNREADLALLQGNLQELFDWLCQSISRPASIAQNVQDVQDIVEERKNSEVSPVTIADQPEEIRPRYSIDPLSRTSIVSLDELSPDTMVFNALRRGDDYFYDFVRYITKYQAPKSTVEAFKAQQEQITPTVIYHRLLRAICGALKMIVEDIKLSLFEGVAVHWCENDPMFHERMAEYRGSLLFVESSLTLYAVSPEGRREVLASYENMQQFEALFPPRSFVDDSAFRAKFKIEQKLAFISHESTQSLTGRPDQKIPFVNQEYWTDEQWRHVLEARLQQLDRVIRHYFKTSGFSAALSKEDNKHYFKTAEGLFLKAIHYYISHDEDSLWSQIPREALKFQIQGLFEQILWADSGALEKYTQSLFELKSQEADFEENQKTEKTNFLSNMLNSSVNGIRFTGIPRSVRDVFDRLIANEKGIDVTELTDEERVEGYKKHLEEYFSFVPLDARDPEKNSLVLLAIQYGNTTLFNYFREAYPKGLTKENHRGLSASSYMGPISVPTDSLNEQERKRKLQLEEEAIREAIRSKDPVGDDLRQMEIFVQKYIASWCTTQTRLENRKNSPDIWDQILESLAKACNLVFNTRDKFNSRLEQAEQCLSHIQEALRSQDIATYCQNIQNVLSLIESERGIAFNSQLYREFLGSVNTLSQMNIPPDEGDCRESFPSDTDSVTSHQPSVRPSEISMGSVSSQKYREDTGKLEKEKEKERKAKEEANKRAEQEAKRVEQLEEEKEKERTEKEKERKEKEEANERAEREAKRADQEAKRAEQLEALLKQRGISLPESADKAAPAPVNPSPAPRASSRLSFLFPSAKPTPSDGLPDVNTNTTGIKNMGDENNESFQYGS